MADQEQNNNRYIWLYHRNKLVKTIKDFMEREHIYGIETEEFFDYNKKLIFSQMSPEEKTAYGKELGLDGWPTVDDLKVDMTLPCPCNLQINASKVTAEIAISQTNAQVNTSDFYAFADEKIQEIYQDEGYKIAGSTKKDPMCRVLGWFKSLYFVGVGSETKVVASSDGRFWAETADISEHVMSMSTLVEKNGGSFTIRLPIINARSAGLTLIWRYFGENRESSEDTGWFGKVTKNDMVYRHDEGYYSKNDFNDIEANYFNWLISSNDLLFLSFEKLEMETREHEYDDTDANQVVVNLAEGVYDMIGLVDSVKVITSPATASGYVEVTGRDLMKLLIEDGSFFFNPSTSSNPSVVFLNEQSYGKQGDIKEADLLNNTYTNPINRLRRISGEIDIFANRTNMDLSFILKGVMSQLANVEVVPSHVFNDWGDDRTKYVELEPTKEK